MNLGELSTATKLLLGAGLLLLIDLFLAWQKVCVGAGNFHACGSQSGWHGVGIIVGLLTIALLVWEGLKLANVDLRNTIPFPGGLVTAALAAGILVFTIIKFLADNEARHWPAWLGLLLSIAIAVGGWMRFTEGDAPARMAGPGTAAPPPPPPA